MSERYNSQKNSSSDFRKLLQERLEKANPRRTEIAAEEKNKKLLKNQLHNRLEKKRF